MRISDWSSDVCSSDLVEQIGAIDDPARHEMDDALAAFLDATFGEHQPRGHDRNPIALELTRPEHDVGDARLVLDRDEARIALARSLADEDDPRGADRQSTRLNSSH